ncbi:RNA polymerase sigma factor [Alkalihalophilus sp. As8PL]|uniref:RNA polymerase sigma factor n=1 Tax=Alkalihalophilus sp. As8PL TaxID=3237103 RepID=A0AB39BPK1_9BACI
MSDKQEVISEWYSLYSKSIFNFVLLSVHEYQLAEDITQETFIKAYKSFEAFKGEASPKTWLFRIARHTTIDFIRRKQPTRYIKEMLNLRVDVSPLPEEVVEIKENSRELFHALSHLKKSYREVIVLRKVKEFSTRETAEILNCSESKVKSTLARAIPALEKELLKGGFCYEESV